jgi:hypothetical protein
LIVPRLRFIVFAYAYAELSLSIYAEPPIMIAELVVLPMNKVLLTNEYASSATFSNAGAEFDSENFI